MLEEERSVGINEQRKTVGQTDLQFVWDLYHDAVCDLSLQSTDSPMVHTLNLGLSFRVLRTRSGESR